MFRFYTTMEETVIRTGVSLKSIIPVTLMLAFALCGGVSAAQSEFDIDPRDLPPSRTDGFELDLKELPPARTGKPAAPLRAPRRKHQPEHREPATAAATGEFSRYTVRPGDHIHLILVRHFGLSDEAAERLAPQVMQINGIRNPRGLQVGQELKIPLALRAARPAGKRIAKSVSLRPEEIAEVRQSAPAAGGTAAEPAPAAADLVLTAALGCTMAKDVARALGLLAPPSPLVAGLAGITTSNADRTVVIACGLTASETYTYERLLAPYGQKLLVLRNDEPSPRVIEQLADRLGLRYTREEGASADALPRRYLFEGLGPERRTVRLTLAPPAEGDKSDGTQK
jgi:hypothetical protein